MAAVSPVTLRPARDSDAREVVALLDAARLEAAFDPREFVVAQEEGRVVAAARLRTFANGTHELASVVVAPHLRGRRVGERVVREALARASGAVYALALAPGFFEKLGFAPLLVLPPELEEKAAGACASSGFVPMRWVPSRDAAVREIQLRYAHAAQGASCCGGGAAASSCCERGAYSAAELAALPEGAHLGLGTGNPVRDAAPQAGEVLLDLGSGAGVDVLLAARLVGPQGRAIGVDFTPEMVRKARENAARAGASNVDVHEAPIERLPVADASVDVVTSNCVINLSLDKLAVLREAYRVLRAGGRFVVSDTLRLPGVAPAAAPSCDCTTGALSADEWRALLAEAGFVDVTVEEGEARGPVGTATVRARKPAA